MLNQRTKTYGRLLLLGAVGYVGGVGLQQSLQAGGSCDDDECEWSVFCVDNPGGGTECDKDGSWCSTSACC